MWLGGRVIVLGRLITSNRAFSSLGNHVVSTFRLCTFNRHKVFRLGSGKEIEVNNLYSYMRYYIQNYFHCFTPWCWFLCSCLCEPSAVDNWTDFVLWCSAQHNKEAERCQYHRQVKGYQQTWVVFWQLLGTEWHEPGQWQFDLRKFKLYNNSKKFNSI